MGVVISSTVYTVGWVDQDGVPDGKKGEGALGGLSDRGVEVVLDANPDANVVVVRWVISFDRLGKRWRRRYESSSEVDQPDRQPNVQLELC